MDPYDDPEALRAILDKIHDLAAKAGACDGVPEEVDEALDKIIALSRYKIDVVGDE